MINNNSSRLLLVFPFLLIIMIVLTSTTYNDHHHNHHLVEGKRNWDQQCRYTPELMALLSRLNREIKHSKFYARTFQQMKKTEEGEASLINSAKASLDVHHERNRMATANWNAGYYIYFVTSGQFWIDLAEAVEASAKSKFHDKIDYSGVGSEALTFQYFQTKEIMSSLVASLSIIAITALICYMLTVDNTETVSEFRNKDDDLLLPPAQTAKINFVLNNTPFVTIVQSKAITVSFIIGSLFMHLLIIGAALWDHSSSLVTYFGITVLVGWSPVILSVALLILQAFLYFVVPGMFRMIMMMMMQQQGRGAKIQKPRLGRTEEGVMIVPQQGVQESTDEEKLLNDVTERHSNFRRVFDELINKKNGSD